jgi:DNA adenine methylase
MRPPITYFGGKILLAERIVATFPAHGHYVEPFCGSLSVLLAKAPSPHETVNDLDGDLMTFWRVLRDQPAELERACALTPHSRAEQAASYGQVDGVGDLERARRVWVQLTQGRAGVRTKTGWRHYQDPSNSTVGFPGYLSGYVSRIAPAAERLRAVSLECRPALDVIADYGRHEGVLLYVDPPYLGTTRSSGSYVVEMTDEQQHRDLADALRGCKASVVLSGYHSPLYDDLFDGWERIEFDTSTGQGGAWEARTEVVWSNRKIGGPDLFDLLNEGAA